MLHVEFSLLRNMASDYQTSKGEGRGREGPLHNTLPLPLSISLFLLFEGGGGAEEKWRDFALIQAEIAATN